MDQGEMRFRQLLYSPDIMSITFFCRSLDKIHIQIGGTLGRRDTFRDDVNTSLLYTNLINAESNDVTKC